MVRIEMIVAGGSCSAWNGLRDTLTPADSWPRRPPTKNVDERVEFTVAGASYG